MQRRLPDALIWPQKSTLVRQVAPQGPALPEVSMPFILGLLALAGAAYFWIARARRDDA